MKNENEIKRAFAMEVIDELLSCGYGKYGTAIRVIESLLPKEEEVDKSKPLTENKTKGNLKPDTPNERQCPPPPPPKKTEPNELTPTTWIQQETDKFIERLNADFERLFYSEPTIEHKARKKAEELCLEWQNSDIGADQIILKALLIDPKTL